MTKERASRAPGFRHGDKSVAVSTHSTEFILSEVVRFKGLSDRYIQYLTKLNTESAPDTG